MATEKATDRSQWRHKKEGYVITVEHSAPKGVTTFRRVVGLGPKAIRKLRSKQTVYFEREFEKITRHSPSHG